MKTYNNLYEEIYSFNNLILAFKKARKGKTKKYYVIEFEKNLKENLLKLQEELKNQTYKTFYISFSYKLRREILKMIIMV